MPDRFVLYATIVIFLTMSFGAATALAVDTETCLMCHEDYDQTLVQTPHALDEGAARAGLSCASCHAGGEVHIEEPVPDNIGNPATLAVGAVQQLCRPCHTPHATMAATGFDPHLALDMSCLSCHRIHSGPQALLPADRAEMCETCHAGISETFLRNSNHPLGEANVSCTDCHAFTVANQPTVGHGATATCYNCHPEQSGPYIHDHPAAISFAVEGGGCLECHQPHGSANRRLLDQPGNALCQQCHGIPPGHRIVHSGLGTKLACVECHSEVHGSNHNSKLLDPELGMKLFPDCYQSGCHIINP